MFTKYAILYSERETLDNLQSTSWCRIIITHHKEVHSLVCNICHYMTQIKAFLSYFQCKGPERVYSRKHNCSLVKRKLHNFYTYEYLLRHNSYNEIMRKLP